MFSCREVIKGEKPHKRACHACERVVCKCDSDQEEEEEKDTVSDEQQDEGRDSRAGRNTTSRSSVMNTLRGMESADEAETPLGRTRNSRAHTHPNTHSLTRSEITHAAVTAAPAKTRRKRQAGDEDVMGRPAKALRQTFVEADEKRIEQNTKDGDLREQQMTTRNEGRVKRTYSHLR
jgi:hypothetical protein